MSHVENEGITPVPLGVGAIYDRAGGAEIGTGYGHDEQPVYPFPKIHQRANVKQQLLRDEELAAAKADNWYNYDLIPGAVVHGNRGASQVNQNSVWTLRGSEGNRQKFAQEDQFDSDDSDPGEDGIDIYEPLFYYFDRNWLLWTENTEVLNNITRLLSVVTENLTDGDGPFFFRVNLLDPILTLAPATKAQAVDTLDFYPPLPERYPRQPFDSDFRDDDVIAWTQVAHSSPFTRLVPYTQHQINFKVNNDIFRRTNDFRFDDIDQAMAEGRTFIVDYKEYQQFNIRPPAENSAGGRFYTPIALFAVPKQGGPLKLIAIQSTQHTAETADERTAWKTSNKQNPERPLSDIMTPSDDYWSWQMAKSLFMSMYAMSSVVDHLSMHVYVAPIAISFYRNISRQHPLRALLEPHLMTLIANNHTGIFWDTGTQEADTYGRSDQGLLTGMMDKVSGWTGKTFLDAVVDRSAFYHFVEQSTPLDRSGQNIFSAITDFPLHDDDDLLPIIERWVGNYLGEYYRSDDDVRGDHELQYFASETAVAGRVNGFPVAINSFKELVDMAARIIYWMSANHALEATLGCNKMVPISYWSDSVPRNDETKSEQDWLNINPPINVGLAVFCASRFFVDLPHDWYRSLGRFPDGHFIHDQRIYPHLKKFQQELFSFDMHIQERNLGRRWGYGMRLPSTLTCSPWN
jgi:arachidonate 15-lipoxygenase